MPGAFSIASVTVGLNLSGGGWNGDLYAYLVQESGFAVLFLGEVIGLYRFQGTMLRAVSSSPIASGAERLHTRAGGAWNRLRP